jgi:hypothetical protein
MLTILLSHKDLDQYEIKIRGELHFNKMDKKEAYVACQPSVTALKSSVDDYSLALSNAAGGTTEDKKARGRSRIVLDDAITRVAKTLEMRANELPEEEGRALINGAGFEIRQAPARKNLSFLEKPTNLTALDVLGFDGTAKVACKKNVDTVSVGVEYQLKEGELWQNGPIFTASTGLITGLPSGTYVNIRVYGIGRKGLKSDPTDYVTVLVS